MASSSTNPAVTLGPPASEKLTRDNFLLWKAQLLPAVRGAQLMGILDGTTPAPAMTIKVETAEKKKEIMANPAYDTWLAKDQQLLGYLLNSLTKDILVRVATLESSAEVWKELGKMFSAHSRARVTNLRMQLANLKKGSMSTAAYFNKMRGIRDELAATGKAVDEDEMVTFILNGLDFDYNPLVSSILGRSDPITMSDLYAQIIAYDMRFEMYQENQGGGQFQSSANSAGRGRGGSRGRGGNRGGRARYVVAVVHHATTATLDPPSKEDRPPSRPARYARRSDMKLPHAGTSMMKKRISRTERRQEQPN